MKNKIIWEVWYTYKAAVDDMGVGTGQVNTAAFTIEEAIAHVQGLKPEEERKVWKVKDKGTIV